MRSKLPFQMRRNQFIGLGVLGILLLVFNLVFQWIKRIEKPNKIVVEFVENGKSTINYTNFNPNDLDEQGWRDLGFSERQVQTILKYKDLLGGFESKEDLAKCYAISPEKYQEMEQYILLPEKFQNNSKNYTFEKRDLVIKTKFNPDNYSVKDWENLGFSVKQAEAIITYKNYLGGSFISKEKFKECFVISSENYQKLAPYLLLPERVAEKKIIDTPSKEKINYTYFDPNNLDLEGWKKLGFSERQAQVILNYKEKKLGGNFKTLEDIEQCFVISSEKFNELKPWIRIQIKEPQITKNKEVKSKTDFSKVDINTINFNQLVEFGFSEKAAGSLIGYRKKLGGFADKKQILEVYHINKDLANKLMTTSVLDNTKVQKYTWKNAPEEFLKSHPYFRRYGEKIIYFRISFPEEKDLLKKIKATPEEVAKMKLYIK